MRKVTDFWDQHLANLKILPARVRHPSWYKNRARYVNMEGEIGFKILGADAHEAVPELMNLYQQTFSMDSLAVMNSQIAVSRSLISIGPAAVPPLLQWATSTNEAERLSAIYALSQIHAQPSAVVPLLVKSLSHTNFQVRIQVAEGLGKFGADAQQAVPALVLSLHDPNSVVRRAATNALRRIDPGAAAKAGVK
jgi:HEAT repeat protein